MRRFLTILLLVPLFGFAQESNLGNWYNFFGNKKIDSKWNWHGEVQYRNYNAIGDLEQLLLRTGIGYNLSENNNNLLVGYGFIRSENYIGDTDDKTTVNEHRIYQQFVTKQKFSRVHLRHRYRFEQRFVEDVFKTRFRYLLGISIPLNNKEMTDKTLYLANYNEVFLNTKANVFDRHRLYGGLGYKLNNSIRFELGYLNQFLPNKNRDQLNINTFINF